VVPAEQGATVPVDGGQAHETAKLALERRESVCQPRRSRGADSAALTEGAAETQNPRKPNGPARGPHPNTGGWLCEKLATLTIQHSIEPGQARNAPPVNACPRPDSGASA
jgi:hypothetical protein